MQNEREIMKCLHYAEKSFDGIVDLDEGNMFFARRHDFVDLQESNAGFGETAELAIKDLEEREKSELEKANA